MTARRPAFVRRAAAILALVSLLAATLMAGTALAATTTKPYSADITAHPQRAGTTVTLTITIVNQTSPQSIGSANWDLPTAIKPVGLATPTSGAAGFAGNQLRLRSMNVLPGATYTVTFDAIMPCVAGTYTSTVKAKQSNDFSGPPGNDFTPNFDADNLKTTVTWRMPTLVRFRGAANQRRDRRHHHDGHLRPVRATPQGRPAR